MKKYALALLVPLAALAQDIRVSGNSTATEVLRSTNTNTASSDRIGVHGFSNPAPNWGVGLQGTGGFVGLRAYATTAGAGTRYGAVATASGGTGNNYGVMGVANGDAGTKYGVYGSASGAGTAYALYCNGNGVYTGTWARVSDGRTKKNIQDYTGALAKVMAVGVKKYDFDQAAFPTVNLKAKAEVGVIAQDIEKVFPDVVAEIVAPASQASGKDAAAGNVTLKGVDYVALVPILLQAIKEQQAQIDALKKKVGG